MILVSIYNPTEIGILVALCVVAAVLVALDIVMSIKIATNKPANKNCSNEETDNAATDEVVEEETAEEVVEETEELAEEAAEETVEEETTEEAAEETVEEETTEEVAEEVAEEATEDKEESDEDVDDADVDDADEENEESDDEVGAIVEGSVNNEIRFNYSFAGKLSESKDETKDYYDELKNYVLSYKYKNKDRIRASISWKRELFTVGRKKVMVVKIKGKTMCLYFPQVEGDKLGTKYKFREAKGKKDADTPLIYRINNPRRCKYAKEIIDIILSDCGLTYTESEFVKYSDEFPCVSKEELLEKGLIRKVEKSFIVSTPVEESTEE